MAPSVLYRVIYGEPKFEYLDPARQILARNLTIEPAILHDHCRHRVQDAQYPGMIPQAGESVKGTFVTGLTDGDIWRLDRFEGYEYDRVKVEVTLLKDGKEAGTAEAETYIWIAGEDSLEKKEWSYEDFMKNDVGKWAGEEMKGELTRHLDLWSSRLHATEVEDVLDNGIDPTGGRAANNVDMAEKLQHDKVDEKLLEKAV